jgi:hypothetical protein
MQALATFRQTGQSLDGQDLSSVCLNGEEETRADGFAIKENRAAATNSLLATQMDTGKPKMVAQEISQRQARLDKSFAMFTVDCQLYRMLYDDLIPFQSFKPFSAPVKAGKVL